MHLLLPGFPTIMMNVTLGSRLVGVAIHEEGDVLRTHQVIIDVRRERSCVQAKFFAFALW